MKRIYTLIFVLLVMAAAASAEVREFTKLSVDVPEGWSAEEKSGTVVVIKDDNTASLTISVAQYEDRQNLAETAKTFSQGLNGTEPKREPNGSYTFMFNNNDSYAVINGGLRSYILVTMTGLANAPEVFQSMTSSITLRESM